MRYIATVVAKCRLENEISHKSISHSSSVKTKSLFAGQLALSLRIRKAAATNFCLVLKSPQWRTGRGASVNNNPEKIISGFQESGYQDAKTNPRWLR